MFTRVLNRGTATVLRKIAPQEFSEEMLQEKLQYLNGGEICPRKRY